MLRTRPRFRGLLGGGRTPEALVQACVRVIERVVPLLPEQECRSCAIVSAQAGDGCTTLALNLADVAGDETRPALVIDAHAMAPQVHTLLGLARGPGLTDVLVGRVRCEEAIRPSPHNPAVHVLTAGDAPYNPARLADAQALRALLAGLRPRYGWIFVDTAPLWPAASAATLARCTDGAIFAVRYGRTRLPLIAQSTALLDEAGVRLLGVVLTQRRFAIPARVYRHL
jgi:succinoglycan biosynthesis transport protein ExoP